VSGDHRDRGPCLPPEAAPALIDQIFKLWILPELEQRDSKLGKDEIRAALVVMSPCTGVSVHINQEATLFVDIRSTRTISDGEAVTTSDVTEILGLRPADLDPDAGWVAFADVGDVRLVAFDFRRNRKRAGRLITLADQYLKTATDALDSRRPGPAIENAFAAAELGVTAQLLLIDDAPTRRHPEKRRWLKQWSKLGNVPEEHSRALAVLASLRRHARYGESQLRQDEGTIRDLIAEVQNLVGLARERVEQGPAPESVS